MPTPSPSIFISTDDLQQAVYDFGLCAPNRAHVARVLRNLADWTDSHSDGWVYWPLPRRAAQKALHEIERRTYREIVEQQQNDLTDQQVRSVLKPVKVFCTRAITRGQMTLAERDQIFAG